jgi:hypothetical protein
MGTAAQVIRATQMHLIIVSRKLAGVIAWLGNRSATNSLRLSR